jgi:MoaA/NifB/PqqE/SkfB family radical SAM enzyme
MDGLAVELTNACNRGCIHCIRNKADPTEFLPPTLAREVLEQARALGFQNLCLTGGEVALYPHLEEFISLAVDHGFIFHLVTNGYRFDENILPLLLAPKNREHLGGVIFSLDGPTAASHDALRGPGSFQEVIEAATFCKLKHIPLSLKSVITNFNKSQAELTDLALLGAFLGARDHSFIHPYPSPRMIREAVIPSPAELRSIVNWIANSLARAITTQIIVDGYDFRRSALFICPVFYKNVNMDYQGNLILCCNLSHVVKQEGEPSTFDQEWLLDLREAPLQKGVILHFHRCAQLMEARLKDMEELGDLTINPCYWCLRHFGKLEWLRDFPESPWAAGVLAKGGSHADCYGEKAVAGHRFPRPGPGLDRPGQRR